MNNVSLKIYRFWVRYVDFGLKGSTLKPHRYSWFYYAKYVGNASLEGIRYRKFIPAGPWSSLWFRKGVIGINF
jgi:hypothetical protein